MSNHQTISTANLSRIENSLSAINDNINGVYQQVATVEQQLEDTQSDLALLAEEFREYVRQDGLIKNVQLAETRLVKVRQELENKYGHYEDVRRRAIGILQAVDTSLVRKDTIENASEEQLLAAPRYWLAPCLIALSAWLSDKKELAEKAVVEALRRDDEKTSLFFALVTRRGGRYQSSRSWLERYFGQQDPNELKREIVILIDGFSNGIFGPEARAKCGLLIKSWLDELSQKAGFIEAQRDQWKKALLSRTEKLDASKFPHLRKYSPTWPQLQHALEGAQLHDIIFQYFNFILTQEIIPSKNLAFAVDQLLDILVREFDEEELPLRREERLNELIIKEDGDKNTAQNLFANEKVVDERLDFTQLLTNFSMYPTESNASVATQKLAIALSKEWINHAHDDLTAENRNAVPIDIEIKLDDWTGTSRDGSNEEELISSLQQHIQLKKEDALGKNKLGAKHWVSLAAGIGFFVLGMSTLFLFIVSAICLFIFLNGLRIVKKNVQLIEQNYEELFANHKQILVATLSDIVDYRLEYETEDANASKIDELLDQVTPEQYTYSTYDSARAVISSN
ncbi:hypothetical protein OHJ21_21645 [Virgibacillus sp. LDC1]|uniref:hypothetical protein n=1 Tax=Paenibacillus TaxID=44249 RepID=UPI000C27FB8E|nr:MULTISPECIES: hypothetical protein [Paenibacillus]MCV4233768.1 hypothetical protein [Virgibacillus sp. LDC1]MEC0309222.1 hypothetical protein [Paenibacillus lautus]PJN51370.1 hypothetical protein PAEVO_44620 [Paenibacillus sp. GM2FR]